MSAATGRPSVKSINEIYGMDPRQVRADFDLVQAERLALTAQRERAAAALRTLTEDEGRLLQQEQLLANVLRMHRDAGIGVPGVAEALESYAAAAPFARERTISANVHTIVRQGCGAAVTPGHVVQRLREVGIDADDKVVRTALRRWLGRGVMERVGSGYRLVESRIPLNA